MGLDMYLTKETYIGAKYEHRKVKGKIEIAIDSEIMPIELNRVESITEQVGCWRKANQIHAWFVENVQAGIDECQTAPVSKDHLIELLGLCQRVKDEHSLAGELLPPQSGFFFGTTELGEWYWQDIDDTISILSPILAGWPNRDSKNYPPEFYYHASW